MTGLLVSVMNLEEAERLWPLNVDVIDCKDPGGGPLAPVDPELWHRLGCRLTPHRGRRAGEVPSGSVALGELTSAKRIAAEVPASIRWAKAGPSTVRRPRDLRFCWDQIRAMLDPRTELVAVAYADQHAAACLPAEEVLAAAASSGMRTFLIDTFAKRGGSSLQQLGVQRIGRLCRIAADRGIRVTLAGSLCPVDVETLSRNKIGVAYVGVRGSVCVGGRSGRLRVDRVIEWQKRLSKAFAPV